MYIHRVQNTLICTPVKSSNGKLSAAVYYTSSSFSTDSSVSVCVHAFTEYCTSALPCIIHTYIHTFIKRANMIRSIHAYMPSCSIISQCLLSICPQILYSGQYLRSVKLPIRNKQTHAQGRHPWGPQIMLNHTIMNSDHTTCSFLHPARQGPRAKHTHTHTTAERERDICAVQIHSAIRRRCLGSIAPRSVAINIAQR